MFLSAHCSVLANDLQVSTYADYLLSCNVIAANRIYKYIKLNVPYSAPGVWTPLGAAPAAPRPPFVPKGKILATPLPAQYLYLSNPTSRHCAI